MKITQQLVSAWINGTYQPSEKFYLVLVEKLGPQVYDALDIPRPDPDLQALTSIWYQIPQEVRHDLRERGEKSIDQ